MRPVDIIRKVAPKARVEYMEAFAVGDGLLMKHGITTPLRLAHFLAQCLHETGGFTIARESGNYRAERIIEIFGIGRHSAGVTPQEAQRLAGDGPALFDRVYGLGNPKKAKELGNTAVGDGWKYRGGGILQTTGRGNYRRMGEKCGVDFEGHPDWVTSARYALVPALTEWTEGNLNAFADKNDILSISRKINIGNTQTTKEPNGFVDREEWFRKVRPLCEGVTFQPSATLPASKPENTTAGAIVVAGGAVAGGAHIAGYHYSTVIGVGVAFAIAAAVILIVMKKARK